MSFNSNLLKSKKSTIINAALKVFLKYILLIVIFNVLQLSLSQINNYFISPKFLKDIIGYALMIIQPWVTISIIYMVYFEIKDGQTNFKELIKRVFVDFKYWIVTSLVYYLIILGLAILLIIPALIAAFYYNFIWQVFVFDKLRNKAALDKSKKEVKERMGDIVYYIVIYIVSIFITTSGAILLRYFNVDNFYINFSTLLVMNTVTAYFTVLMTFVYLLYKGHLVYLDKNMDFTLAKGFKI